MGYLLPAAALLAAAAAAGAGQEQEPVFRAETNLALIPFHVVQKDRYVLDVAAGDVEILEDGKPQKLAMFEGPDTAGGAARTPVEILLLLDVSDSVMNPNLLDTFAIKETFLDGIGQHAGVGVYAFGRKWRRFTRPTRDIPRLKRALEAAYDFANSGTRLYESIIQTARDATASGPGVTRLMVILSDGQSTTKMKPEEAVKAANEAGIPLYPVVLGHERVMRQAAGRRPGLGNPRNPRNLPGMAPPTEAQARAQAREMEMFEFAGVAKPSGGRSFDPQVINATVVRAIFESLVNHVRSEYVAGYYPGPSGPSPRSRHVEIRLKSKGKGRLEGGKRILAR